MPSQAGLGTRRGKGIAALLPLPATSNKTGSATGKVHRLHALDAMRGIFAIFIILGHFYITLPPALQHDYNWLFVTPLRWAPAVVVAFFMLSGFVLALPYNTPKPPGYALFLIRRLSRLYIPFAAIMVIAFLLYVLIGIGPDAINDMTFHTTDRVFPRTYSLSLLIRALSMTGLRQDNMINPAIWSLVHEMRISFIFPFLVLLCRRSWLAVLFMIACYALVAWGRDSIAHYVVFPAITDDELTTWFTTIYVTPCFMFGIFLAQYKDRILDFLSEWPPFLRVMAWILVLVNFSFMPDFDIHQPFTEFGAALLLMLVLSSENIADVSEGPILQGLGRISYSVYLVHLPILYALKSLWEGKVALIWLFMLCLAITLPVAMLAQRFIETPARMLAKKWSRAIL